MITESDKRHRIELYFKIRTLRSKLQQNSIAAARSGEVMGDDDSLYAAYLYFLKQWEIHYPNKKIKTTI